MLGFTWNTSKPAFNARLLTTFGKLDEQDIADINGCQKRLVTELINRYGWNADDAQSKVDQFSSTLTNAQGALPARLTHD